MSGAEREAANLEFELTDQVDVLNRRLEWMGAGPDQGSGHRRGEGFDTVVVDFGRDPELTVGLTSAKRWTRANIGTESNPGSVSPSDDVTAWATLILKKSGAQVQDIVFSISAWQAFKQDPALKGAIVFPAQAPFGNQVNPATSPVKGRSTWAVGAPTICGSTAIGSWMTTTSSIPIAGRWPDHVWP